MTSRFSIAKERIVDAIDDVVPELFGSGKRQAVRLGGRWAVANKWRAGASIDQMSVRRSGASRGAFIDFAGDVRGDAIDLVAYGLEGEISQASRMRAVEWAEDRFGIRAMDEGTRRELEAKAVKRRAELDAQQQRLNKAQHDRARKFHFACEPVIRGTEVEHYLREGRGIDLDLVPQLAPSIRFHPECEYWMGQQRDGEGNKIGTAPRFPAMIAMMITPAGQIGANHYTFLEPGKARKLDTAARGFVRQDGKPQSAKLMYPPSAGMFIPVTLGPHGLKAREAAERGMADWWGWTEGIEDALSAAIGDPRLRMHAAGSLSHLMGIPDHPAARGYLIFKDNDWNNPQATAAFEAAVARAKGFGKPVEALAMPAAWGKDVNDALRMEP
jgi:hypothetical protein